MPSPNERLYSVEAVVAEQRPIHITSVRCVTAQFYGNRATHINLCTECFLYTVPLHRRPEYFRAIRHYVSIGERIIGEECRNCRVALTISHPVARNNCGRCMRVYLDYTQSGFENFPNNGDTLVIIHLEFRRPIDNNELLEE